MDQRWSGNLVGSDVIILNGCKVTIAEILLSPDKYDGMTGPVDAPVQRYLPSFPEKQYPITVRQLAGHLAGIRHYQGDESLGSRHYETVLEGLEIFRDDPLLFEPGTQYSYSTYGYNLLSAVLEGASGKPFLAQMEERVFEPLGMRHTSADQNRFIVFDRVRPYIVDDEGRFANAPHVDNSYKWAGGGFLSTAEDLVRFGFAHLEPRHFVLQFCLHDDERRPLASQPSGMGVCSAGWNNNDRLNRHGSRKRKRVCLGFGQLRFPNPCRW